MNSKQLAEHIKSDEFSSLLKGLYGKDRVEEQKERYLRTLGDFVDKYGDYDDIRVYSVPGRTEILGNHTDHNNGLALAGSIDLDIIAFAAPDRTRSAKVKSRGFRQNTVIYSDLEKRSADEDSTELVRGICAAFAAKRVRLPGFCAYTDSDVPKGSGLSSSAAFEVMVALILNDLTNSNFDVVELAKMSQFAENEYYHKPCGLLDQLACAHGGIISIDFREPSAPLLEASSLDLDSIGYSLCIVNTGAEHGDLTDEYAAVRGEMAAVASLFEKKVLRELTEDTLREEINTVRCLVSDRGYLRACHFFAENRRVNEALNAIKDGDVKRLFEMINASGISSERLCQNIFACSDATNQPISVALEESRIFINSIDQPCACRVHGGGFAGTVCAYLPSDKVEAYVNRMCDVFPKGTAYKLNVRRSGAVRVI